LIRVFGLYGFANRGFVRFAHLGYERSMVGLP